jgi:hypothetical protein
MFLSENKNTGWITQIAIRDHRKSEIFWELRCNRNSTLSFLFFSFNGPPGKLVETLCYCSKSYTFASTNKIKKYIRVRNNQSILSSVISTFRFAISRIATVAFPDSTPEHSPGFITGVPSIILTPGS